MAIRFITVRTRPVLPPQDDLYGVLRASLPRLREGDVVCITSKVLAIHQGRCVKVRSDAEKDRLIRREAERLLPRRAERGAFLLTIKGHTLIPSSGIDFSNGNGYAVLWPRDPHAGAREICRWLKRKFRMRKLAVIVTDSHTIPLRYGVVGIAIGFFGLQPLFDYRGRRDIFGRKLLYTRTNIVDALAAMAVLLMGEGNEQTPIAIIRGAPFIRFADRPTHRSLFIPPEKDLYRPILQPFRKPR